MTEKLCFQIILVKVRIKTRKLGQGVRHERLTFFFPNLSSLRIRNFTDKFSAFVKVGLTKAKVDYSYTWESVDINNMNVLDSEEDGASFEENGLHYGIGVGYAITENLNFFAEYEVYQVKSDEDLDEDIAALNAGMKVIF